MTFKDAVEISSAILVSLGGGGAIVYRLSGYLGKLWADKALQEQQQKYVQLNLQLQNQLDVAARRLQVELDTLGHLHKLRTEESVSKIAGLWKRIATLQNWFNLLAGEGIRLVPADEQERKKQEEEFRRGVYESLNDAQQYMHEEMLFIPKHVADIALEVLAAAQREKYNFVNFGPFLSSHAEMRQAYFRNRGEYLSAFNEKAADLQKLAREYLDGQSPNRP